MVRHRAFRRASAPGAHSRRFRRIVLAACYRRYLTICARRHFRPYLSAGCWLATALSCGGQTVTVTLSNFSAAARLHGHEDPTKDIMVALVTSELDMTVCGIVSGGACAIGSVENRQSMT